MVAISRRLAIVALAAAISSTAAPIQKLPVVTEDITADLTSGNSASKNGGLSNAFGAMKPARFSGSGAQTDIEAAPSRKRKFSLAELSSEDSNPSPLQMPRLSLKMPTSEQKAAWEEEERKEREARKKKPEPPMEGPLPYVKPSSNTNRVTINEAKNREYPPPPASPGGVDEHVEEVYRRYILESILEGLK